MDYSPSQANFVLNEVRRILSLDEPDDMKVRHVWQGMALGRAYILAATMRHYLGDRVYSGPFKGMRLTPEVMDGVFAPVLLGTYEHELHTVIERCIAAPYKNILNIGCAYGYYSVGLALRMPNVIVHAFDIDKEAQTKCSAMAALNDVQDRITVGGEFRGEDFATYSGPETLVIMDVEGAETGLLDPARYAALQKMTVIVELHDLFDPAISSIIRERFARTHNVTIISNKTLLADIQMGNDPTGYIDPFDKLLLTWENRDGPTPWAVMQPKN